MELAFYFYTLSIMALCIISASLVLAAYFVSHHRGFIYAMLAALFYFSDSSLIFLDDYLDLRNGFDASLFYAIPHPLLRTLISLGLLLSLWLVICSYFDEKRKPLIVAPGILYLVACLAICYAGQPGPVQQFAYYSMRQLFLAFIALYAFYRYRTTKSKSRKMGMRKYMPFAIFFCVMIVLIFFEDYMNIIYIQFDSNATFDSLLPYISERNFCENILAIALSIASIKRSAKYLSLRYSMTPETGLGQGAAMEMDNKLPIFEKRYGLTKREMEVLRLLLESKDNQNISSILGVSPGTVKAHIHHIFTKAGCSSRQDLKEKFWSS